MRWLFYIESLARYHHRRLRDFGNRLAVLKTAKFAEDDAKRVVSCCPLGYGTDCSFRGTIEPIVGRPASLPPGVQLRSCAHG